MATMHATADFRNVQRSVLASVAPRVGAPLVPDGDEKFNTADASSFVRAQFETVGETFSGRVTDSGTTRRVTRADVLLVLECYAQGNGLGPGGAVDEVDGLAARAAHAVRMLDVTIADYVTDPTGATTTPASVRFIAMPRTRRVPPADGWHRRIVTVEGVYFLRHQET